MAAVIHRIKDEIREAVQRSSQKLVAHDLAGHAHQPKPKPSNRERMRKQLKRLQQRDAYDRTRGGLPERSG